MKLKNYLLQHNIYEVRQWFKIGFLVISILLAAIFLYMSNDLVRDLSVEERNKMEIWAEATRQLASASDNVDVSLVLKVVQGNTSIPVIIADKDDHILMHVNVVLPQNNTDAFMLSRLQKLKEKGNLILLHLDEQHKQYLYYDDSILLKRLSYYPYIQLGVMLLFIGIAYVALMSSKRAEQNKVFVGLSKETAHQLGTPISSLLAWVEMLQIQGVEQFIIDDMSKDVKRLSVIADRFSKIGSRPELEFHDINEVLQNATEYMRRRISGKVELTTELPQDPIGVMICLPLFEWVIENLCKNAIDAMGGVGKIWVTLKTTNSQVIIDIQDTGKGISRKAFKTVFSPGYTTKKRGWGLGLTLVKRIVEEFHAGRIYVKDSEVGKGTTFRIELNRL